MMAYLDGKIYYTTDGTDPRLRGSAISRKALEHKEPVLLTASTHIFAGVRRDYSLWSAPVVVNP